jgi:hypothetical protein
LNLLEEARRTNSFYGEHKCQWGEHERRTLRQWREALALERNSTA